MVEGLDAYGCKRATVVVAAAAALCTSLSGPLAGHPSTQWRCMFICRAPAETVPSDHARPLLLHAASAIARVDHRDSHMDIFGLEEKAAFTRLQHASTYGEAASSATRRGYVRVAAGTLREPYPK